MPIYAALALAGFLVLSIMIGPALRSTFGSQGVRNDFLSFYSGAKLLPACELYRLDATLELQRRLNTADGTPPVYISYVRPPFYAALLSPLARLDYGNAYAIFQAGSLLSFGLAMALWRRFDPGVCLLLVGFSSAMAVALLRGQDDALVLLFTSLSAALLRKGRHFGSGAILALGLIKWHLFLILPFLIVARKMYRFGAGFVTATGALLALSFARCLDWPLEYWRALRQTEPIVHVTSMPNLRSLLHGIPGEPAVQVLGLLLGVALCWRVFRSPCGADEALATCLIAGVIFSAHAYAYDCVLVLPAVVVAVSRLGRGPVVKAWCAAGLGACPALLAFELWRFIPQLALFALFLWLSAAMIRRDVNQVDAAALKA